MQRQEADSFIPRIAMWSARHRKPVALGWLILVLLAFGACTAVKADTKVTQSVPGEAGRAFDLYKERFRLEEETPQEIAVFQHPNLSVEDASYKQTVSGLMEDLRGLRTTKEEVKGGTKLLSSTRLVSSTVTHYDTGVSRERSPFVAKNKTGGDVTFAFVGLEGTLLEAQDHIDTVLDAVKAAQAKAPPGFEILMGGDASIQKQSEDVTNEDFGRALFLNLPITLVILLLAFGALLAALVPLALAMAAVITASGICALISQVNPLSQVYTEMVLLMGLATGTDYALFVLSRSRTERRAGHSKEESLLIATATSGKAVFFAGVTVLLAIAGMFLVGNVIFTSLAIASIVVVAMAILISVTLLPALLAMLGDNVDRLKIPFLNRGGGAHGGFWGMVSDQVLARPAILATITLVALLALAAPILTLNLGFNGNKSLPNAVDAKKALTTLEENFTLGLTSPAVVVVDPGKNKNVFAEDVQSHIDQFTSLVSTETASPSNPNAPYGQPIRTEVNDAGDLEAIRVPVNADTGEDKAIDAVNHLRDDLVPGAFADSPAKAQVTGNTAFNIDFRDNIIFRTPFVFSFVLGLAFLILLLTFRSLVIAVKAIILNLLSVGAAYGLLVLVFQKGWLLEPVLSFDATGIIESWLPLFLFSILFGLSMDYHMFIMGRIKEAHEHGMSNAEAISAGVKATAGTITNAAAIMVAIAIIFAFARDIALKQFGFGLAAAILIDATVIRSILLPASMKLLGEANWYLPGWLKWLPEIRMAE